MQTYDCLGELQVMEMSESRINGSTTVKYNYLTQNEDHSTGEGRNEEQSAVGRLPQQLAN